MQREDDIIAYIKHKLSGYRRLTSCVGIGDDAAVIDISNSTSQLVCVDLICERVDFDFGCESPIQVGRKALTVNLSDIAAMGGTPTHALLALNIPKSMNASNLKSFIDGFVATAAEFNVAIIGGDTNVYKGEDLSACVTVFGQPHQRGSVLRSGAKAGDVIVVTGSLGATRSGNHLNFVPRMAEIKHILDLVPLNSMVDLSDGLARDLGHIAKASELCAVLNPSCIPISSELTGISDHAARLKHALTDGEDFELCFTLSAEHWQLLKQNYRMNTPLFAIGEMTPLTHAHQFLCWNSGKPIKDDGFSHSIET